MPWFTAPPLVKVPVYPIDIPGLLIVVPAGTPMENPVLTGAEKLGVFDMSLK